MKIIRSSQMQYVPAGHEDPKNPGVLKKVLFTKSELQAGQPQMINWAKLPVGKSFQAHTHTDMQEVFIILSGQAEIEINQEKSSLFKGDAVLIPIGQMHCMRNTGSVDVEYITLGVVAGGA